LFGSVFDPKARAVAESEPAEAVSVTLRYGRAVFPAGPETKEAVTVIESPLAVGKNEIVATADDAV